MRQFLILFILTISTFSVSSAQTTNSSASVSGKVLSPEGEPLIFASVLLKGTKFGITTDDSGNYKLANIPAGVYILEVSFLGFATHNQQITLTVGQNLIVDIKLKPSIKELEVVVISGTMKEVSKSDSPVPVEVYNKSFFKANPTPSIFESLQNVNGVRPQLNCNVCNTGDIHMNGLEGPYTMVLIDGMPIVSGLSTVYGLTGIPQALIERVEIVKGPASTLYGSEAVGGLINIITKNPTAAPRVVVDIFGTGWGEINTDLGLKYKTGKKATSLLGINYFYYQNPIDNNGDGFTDLTLQNRISIFNKINFERNENRVFSIAGRYVYEDRWGGQMNYEPKYRGGNEVYGESIYTGRWEHLRGNRAKPK